MNADIVDDLALAQQAFDDCQGDKANKRAGYHKAIGYSLATLSSSILYTAIMCGDRETEPYVG